VGRELGVEIGVYRVGEKGDLVCGRGEWENAAGVTRQGAVLVRPDDVVVCRWRRGVSDSKAEIMRGMKIGLCLD
jgi:putative polyketide hydroxylase